MLSVTISVVVVRVLWYHASNQNVGTQREVNVSSNTRLHGKVANIVKTLATRTHRLTASD
jgi:hypothetical protein